MNAANILNQAYRKIIEANNILLVTHYNPDGDGLASICAMIELLKQLNKDYFAYCYHQPPDTLYFLPHIEEINFFSDRNPDLGSFDLILVFDCGSLDRTRLTEEIRNREARQIVIEFDHHPKVDDYSDLEIRDSKAAATTEVVYQFFKANKLRINKRIANCILTGILTDTANFLYPATSEKTITIASEMMTMGGKLPNITENTLRNKSLAAMKLWGKIMANLKINEKYNIAFTILTLEDINGNKVNKDELEGISGFLSNLYGVKAVMLLQEEENGKIRGNLRTSHPLIDISKLAQKLGGGGHPKASGFSIEARLKKTDSGWQIE